MTIWAPFIQEDEIWYATYPGLNLGLGKLHTRFYLVGWGWGGVGVGGSEAFVYFGLMSIFFLQKIIYFLTAALDLHLMGTHCRLVHVLHQSFHLSCLPLHP